MGRGWEVELSDEEVGGGRAVRRSIKEWAGGGVTGGKETEWAGRDLGRETRRAMWKWKRRGT